jgi:hypothetical protein
MSTRTVSHNASISTVSSRSTPADDARWQPAILERSLFPDPGEDPERYMQEGRSSEPHSFARSPSVVSFPTNVVRMRERQASDGYRSGRLRTSHSLVHLKRQCFDALGESPDCFRELRILFDHLHEERRLLRR